MAKGGAPLAAPLLPPAAPRPARMVCLYLFAFWSQFQPSEPFLVEYLVDHKGLAADEVYRSVFCLFVYCRLPCVALVGWASGRRWVDCRTTLIVGAACGLATALLTRFGEHLLLQQLAQLTVAAAFASRVAVPAIAFGIAGPEAQQASLHGIKAVMLLSNFGAAAVGELLRGYVGMPLNALFGISAAGQAVTLLCAILLPRLDGVVAPAAPRVAEPATACVQKLVSADLLQSLTRRAVLWWTAWALWMNPVHGLAMTYWQGLVRQKQIPSEHNGAVLACTYLAAAVATAVAGGCVALRRSPASLVIASMVGAGALLLKVVAESRVLPVYALLVLYQCLFEVTTAIGTFQVGEAVVGWFAGGSDAGRAAPSAATARLTALFSATAVAAGANESAILLVVNKWPTIDVRFFVLGTCLLVCAGILLVAREVEALVAWRSGGKAVVAPSVLGPVPVAVV